MSDPLTLTVEIGNRYLRCPCGRFPDLHDIRDTIGEPLYAVSCLCGRGTTAWHTTRGGAARAWNAACGLAPSR